VAGSCDLEHVEICSPGGSAPREYGYAAFRPEEMLDADSIDLEADMVIVCAGRCSDQSCASD